MKDKVFIVTGAASGVGEAAALALAQQGAHVLIADIDEENAERVATSAAQLGTQSKWLKVDMGEEEAIRGMIAFVADTYGRLDGLVNNAADLRLIFHDSDIVDTKLDVWDRAYQVNLRGPVTACKLAVPLMVQQETSAIVNVSSIQSVLGDKERIAYSAMKSALNSISRSIATSHGRQGLRCNTVCLGPVMSRNPEKRWPEKLIERFQQHILLQDVAYTDQAAETITFLLSDAAAPITGQTLTADCGFSSHMHFHQRSVPEKNRDRN